VSATTWESAKSIAIYLLGLAGVILGAIPAFSVSISVHATLVAVGGILVAVERFLQGQVALVKLKAKARI
jgi:hypothetical protein